MNTVLQKKWLIILQGIFFSLAGLSIFLNGFNNSTVAILLLASAISGAFFLTSNTKVDSIKLFKSLLTIEVIMTLISAIAIYFWGSEHFISIFAFFSIFFGIIPFLFLFGILSSGTKLNFNMAKFRLIGGALTGIFGFYLIAAKHTDLIATTKNIGIAMIIIGLIIIYGFRLGQKILNS